MSAPTPPVGQLRLDPTELESPSVVLVVSWRRHVALAWAGRRDGRREARPDPADGHTPYTRRILARSGTAARAEQLRRQVVRSRIAEQLARLAAESDSLREVVVAVADEPAGPAVTPGVRPTVTAARAAEVRARRDAERGARVDEARRRIAAIRAEVAALDELAHHHECAHTQRVARLRHHTEQLIAIYWRSFIAAHPEAAELRAGYAIPMVVLPAGVPED